MVLWEKEACCLSFPENMKVNPFTQKSTTLDSPTTGKFSQGFHMALYNQSYLNQSELLKEQEYQALVH